MSSVAERVVKIVCEKLKMKPEQVGPETSFVNDLGADSLDVVESGRVSVQLAVDGTSREIAVVGPGQVLGEMSLMTGAPRQATCIALTDVVCYVLDREAFASAVGASPGLAERLCEILARRQEELDVEREGLSAAARARRLQERKARLLPRIQRFLWGT